MKGFGKALMGMIRVSMNRTIARKISSGVTTLALVGSCAAFGGRMRECWRTGRDRMRE